MKTFKQFNESRDPQDTIRRLETLAYHPKTPPHEAEAAKLAIQRIHKNNTETKHREQGKKPDGQKWSYMGEVGKPLGHIIKHNSADFETQHSKGPNIHHSSFADAHKHMNNHGYFGIKD